MKSPVLDGWSAYWRISAKEGGEEEERVEKEGDDVDADGIDEGGEAVAAVFSLDAPPFLPRVRVEASRDRRVRAPRILKRSERARSKGALSKIFSLGT